MSNWTPSLNALRAYEAVARHLSYKTAAEELNVTPAALKQLLVKLEATVGTKLIRRKGHSLELTPNGAAGQTDMKMAMFYIQESVKKMRRSHRQNRLIVTVESSLATNWLAPRLETFRKKHPHIDVLIDSSQRIVDLQTEDVDVAIRYGVRSREEHAYKRLFEDVIIPVYNPRMMDTSVKLRNLEDLRHVPLLHWDLSQTHWAKNTHQWYDWSSWLKRHGIEGVDTAKGFRFSDYGLALQAAISGQGVLLAGWPGAYDPMKTGLLECPFPDSLERTDIGFDVVTQNEAAQRPDVAAFVDWLVEAAGQCAHLDLLPK